MKVKLLKDHNGGKKGETIEVDSSEVAGLKIRGIAVKALDEKAEKAAVDEQERAAVKAERIKQTSVKKPVSKSASKKGKGGK